MDHHRYAVHVPTVDRLHRLRGLLAHQTTQTLASNNLRTSSVRSIAHIYDVCTTRPTIYLKGRRHPRSPHLSSMHIQQVPIRSTHIAYALPVRIGASKIGPPSTHKDISRNSRSTSESALGHARARSAAIVNHHIPDWFSEVQSMGVPRA